MTQESSSLPGPAVPSSAAVSERMSRHPRRDTQPEIRLRRALHASGLRFRLQYPVPGFRRRTIDIAFPREQVAVFVDGCFWHGCADHRGYPKANAGFWRTKINRNVERDRETADLLREQGWLVIRIWEHESLPSALSEVESSVRSRRPAKHLRGSKPDS
jgi:DNA mismatch endonuclease, patch repair protein